MRRQKNKTKTKSKKQIIFKQSSNAANAHSNWTRIDWGT